jgi:hypothetical protein
MVLATLVGAGVCFAAEDSTPSTPRTTELVARFRDGTTIRRITLQDGLELQTKYGKLTVPINAIRRVEFGRHASDETAKQVTDAVKQLGGTDFQQREAATKKLIALGASAYPALVEAAKGTDQEVVRRAQTALLAIRERIPEEELRIPAVDVIHTADCVLSGHILSPVLKGKTANFGELSMKLDDLRTIHALSEVEVKVDASKHSVLGSWMDTGFHVDGDLGLVIVSSGKVDLFPQQAGQHVADPNGIVLGPPVPVGTLPTIAGQTYSPGMLLGRIGETGEPFMVGQRFAGKFAQVGRLYLTIAPLSGSAGSTGSFTVKVASDPAVTERPKTVLHESARSPSLPSSYAVPAVPLPPPAPLRVAPPPAAPAPVAPGST